MTIKTIFELLNGSIKPASANGLNETNLFEDLYSITSLTSFKLMMLGKI